MIIYRAERNNMSMYINKDLIPKYKDLGYEIYEINTENNIENIYKLEGQ